MNTQNSILIQKLDEFIRRYYKNQLLKGSIYAGGILLCAFLIVTSLEYLAEFGTAIRAFLFFGFLSATIFVLIKFIFIPLLKLNKIGPVITYDQAAGIIGRHFTSVQDKLLNVLQLQNLQAVAESDELLLAGINQKINELKHVPFSTAINFSENKKYLKYVLPLFLITTLVLLIWPQVFSKSTERLVHYQTYYEKEMPFQITIDAKELKAVQTQDFKLNITINGSQLPNEVLLNSEGIEYRFEKLDNSHFCYTFSNLQHSVTFQINASGYLSKEYTLEVLPKPSLLQVNVVLNFPAYLKRPAEKMSNSGDIQIPEGTTINWEFNTKNTELISLAFNDTTTFPSKTGENKFEFSRLFKRNNAYTIKTGNQFVKTGSDSVTYAVNVLPDQYPTIQLEKQSDSVNTKNIYFSGFIKDDYGFSKLLFHFSKYSTDSSGKEIKTQGFNELSFSKSQVSQPFYYFLDAGLYNLVSGDKIEYYFEIHDNDGVNGPKSTRSELMVFKAPTREELNQTTSKNNSEIKKDLEESINKTKQLQKDINDIAKKINDKKQLGYEEKKKIEDLIQKQQDLQSKIDNIKKENEQNNKQQQEFSQTDESILEKQQQLEQLFENVMTPEMKKLFDELNKMLEKLDKNKVQEKLEELKLTNEDIEKELDRNLEAFKQLEVSQKMQNIIDKLEELKQKEEELQKQTEGKNEDQDKKESGKDLNNKDSDSKNKKGDTDELQKKQEEINKDFEALKKEIEDLKQKNEALEEPNKIPSNEQLQNEISNELKNSSQQLNQNNKKGAAKSQKSAGEKMDQMKEEMEKAMEEEEESQQEENAQTLRQILENLVNLSFAQEELLKELPQTRIDDPRYVLIPKQQNKLKEDAKLIEDSLQALSKRAPQISAIVNREINAIHLNMDKTVSALAERNTGEGSMRMQSTMTSVNNLALLLNEALEQMQQQMKQKKENKGLKSGKCKKPGNGTGKNPSNKGMPATSMRKLQEQLNQQMQQMKEALEKGQKPGDKPGDKKGQKPGSGMGQNGQSGTMMPGSSEQFAKMAAQQEALRRQMQSLMEKLKNKGANPGGDLANLMEQTEKDLVNKRLTNETMRRQQEILTRLLESEKAEREREQDEQRKSNEAKLQNLSNPKEFLEYKRQKEKEMELLNTVPPGLTPFYKEKVNTYFNELSK